MIYLVAFRAPAVAAVNAAIERTKTSVDGWAIIARGQDPVTRQATAAMLVATQAGSTALRGFLAQPGLQVLVQRVTGDWATSGFQDTANWLQSVNALF